MKRWAVLVVLFYFLILVSLTAPLMLFAFYPATTTHDAISPFAQWIYWAGLAVMLAAQAVMLIVPVGVATGRPAAKQSIVWTILASGLMMGLLVVGAAGCINEFIRKEKANATSGLVPFALLLVVWAGWTILFYRTGRGADAMDVVTSQCRWLLKGSTLELLIAVPTHIVARARGYCCAGISTFLGITFGIAVMLFSYGPGVFFLFAARWKRLRPQHARATS